ncbi:MAG TPA: hypothetical protein VFY23_04165 [Candidatus Limnocylindrales bacterium]|nr:hypothetical protein [Candidatus Limnocylindrales bacterium]
MTERVLPAVSVPAHGARPSVGAGPVVRTGPAAVDRREPFLTTPARAGLLLGGSAAIYAVTLAGVAMLQASDDAAVAARRQPFVDQVAETRAANDALEAALRRASDDATWLAGVYDDVSDEVADYQARLDNLARLVAEVEGSAAALPSRIALPAVTMRGAIVTTRSAGSSSGGGTSSPPSTNGSSGGSGG